MHILDWRELYYELLFETSISTSKKKLESRLQKIEIQRNINCRWKLDSIEFEGIGEVVMKRKIMHVAKQLQVLLANVRFLKSCKVKHIGMINLSRYIPFSIFMLPLSPFAT